MSYDTFFAATEGVVDDDDYEVPPGDNEYEEVGPPVPERKYTQQQNGCAEDMRKVLEAKTKLQMETNQNKKDRSSDYDPLWPDDEVFSNNGDVIYEVPEELSSSVESIAIDKHAVLQRPSMISEISKEQRFSMRIVSDSLVDVPLNQRLKTVRKSRKIRSHEEYSKQCRKRRTGGNKGCTFYATLQRKNHLQKTGPIHCKIPNTRLWKELHCVVTAEALCLYESRVSGGTRLPLCSLPLSSRVHMRRLGKEKNKNVFSVSSPGLTLLLGTLETAELEAWMSVIEGFVRVAKRLDGKQTGKIEGYCVKVKHGFRRKRYLSLIGSVLFYSKERGTPPLGRITLGHAKLDTFDPDEISDPEDDVDAKPEYSLQITTPRAVYHLLFPSRLTRDRWAFYCATVIGVFFKRVGTVLERGMSRYIEETQKLKKTCGDGQATPHVSTPERSHTPTTTSSSINVQADQGLDSLTVLRKLSLSQSGTQPVEECNGGDRSTNATANKKEPIDNLQTVAYDSDDDDDDEFPFWITEEDLSLLNPLQEPLTTLPSPDLEKKAMDMWRNILLFCNIKQQQKGIAYHYKLAEQLLASVFIDHPVLWDEFLCQLIKVTNLDEHRMVEAFDDEDVVSNSSKEDEHTNKKHSHTSSSQSSNAKNSNGDLTTKTTGAFQTVPSAPRSELIHWGFQRKQAWQLLSLACPLRKPGKLVLRFLRAYLDDAIANNSGEEREYARYCRRCVYRTMQLGDRTCIPSHTELESVMLRHPNDFSHPMSVPVYVSNDNHFIAGFDSSTTFNELAASVCASLGVRHPNESGFALFLNDPSCPEEDVEHCMVGSLKVADAFATWEREFVVHKQGKIVLEPPVVTLKKRYWFGEENATSVERVLLCYEIGERMHEDTFPLSARNCIKIAAYLAQIEYGDLSSVEEKHVAAATIKDQYLPCRNYSGYIQRESALSSISEEDFYNDNEGGCVFEKEKSMRDLLKDWSTCKGKDVFELADKILSIASTWDHMASTVFSAQMKPGHLTSFPQEVFLSISGNGITLLSEHFENIECIPFDNVKSFGVTNGLFNVCYESKFAANESPGLRSMTNNSRTITSRVKEKLSTVSIPRPSQKQQPSQHAQQQQLEEDSAKLRSKLLRSPSIPSDNNATVQFEVDQAGEFSMVFANYVNHIVAKRGITAVAAKISQTN
eukprot:m.117255 g.117255  ORF g.117255 m.117255 type:complete len:1176 (+) comp12870_c2_seq2:126-3653(+)